MDEKQKAQIEYWLQEFVKLHNNFSNENNKPLAEYWKGQVMGISKVANLINSEIDTTYYLNLMH